MALICGLPGVIRDDRNHLDRAPRDDERGSIHQSAVLGADARLSALRIHHSLADCHPAEYADKGFSQARVAAVLYAATMLLMGLSFSWGWRYLAVHPELVAKPARVAFPTGTRRALLGGLVYFVAIALALINPAASFAIDALVAGYFALSRSEVPGLIYQAAQSDGAG
jgi:hypothetical protein